MPARTRRKALVASAAGDAVLAGNASSEAFFRFAARSPIMTRVFDVTAPR